MSTRRNLLLAGLGVAAAATAEALRPRMRLILLRSGTIEDAIPTTVGTWIADARDALVSPDMAGKLAQSLYKEIVARTYIDSETGAGVMVLIAYGDTQSDLLQLHRPETCYPAVGFTLRSSDPVELTIGGRTQIPARRVVAYTRDRSENILYWTRMGERLPQSLPEQREARLGNAMQGFVADGILVRFSVLGDPDPAFGLMESFVPAFLRGVPAAVRPALVGTRLAKSIAA